MTSVASAFPASAADAASGQGVRAENLDDAQRAVVASAIGASGVVVGAPGTGKTTAVVARVVALVERGVDPDEIVVLTPSRQTATALRDRLAVAVDAHISDLQVLHIAATQRQRLDSDFAHLHAIQEVEDLPDGSPDSLDQ